MIRLTGELKMRHDMMWTNDPLFMSATLRIPQVLSDEVPFDLQILFTPTSTSEFTTSLLSHFQIFKLGMSTPEKTRLLQSYARVTPLLCQGYARVTLGLR